MSLVIVASNNVMAQTLDTILEQRKAFENNPQIRVGSAPSGIAVNNITNKVYVANTRSGTISVIDITAGGATKNIRVGASPSFIAVDDAHNKIYVANFDSNTISVIDGNNDNEIGQIRVGKSPEDIVITHGGKIYVTNYGSNSVSVIDTSNDTREPHDIAVGKSPVSIAEEPSFGKIYVANFGSNTVSVIDGGTNRVIKNITVGKGPTDVAITFAYSFNRGSSHEQHFKVYVANFGNTSNPGNTVSVIDGGTNRVIKNITVGKGPALVAVDDSNARIYATNLNNSVSVIDGFSDSEIWVIPIAHSFYAHGSPGYIASVPGQLWVANIGNNSVSIINGSNYKQKPHNIAVGREPYNIAFNGRMIYVTNHGSNTVSVIDGSSNKVVAGVTLNTHPANAGTILCGSKEYPTNIYLYINAGTNCTAQPNKDFQFTGWAENLNRNSTILLNTSINSTNSTSLLNSFLTTLGIIKPNDTSPNLTVNRYGTFTANFKPTPPPIPPEFWLLLVGIILSSLFGWSIPSIMAWVRARTKRKESVKEYDDIIKRLSNTLDQKSLDTINNQVISAYTNEKISEFQYKILDKKISEYYDKIKDKSNSEIGKSDNSTDQRGSKRSPV